MSQNLGSPRELVVLLHPVHAPITEVEAKAVLDEVELRGVIKTIALDAPLTRDGTGGTDWAAARRALVREFDERLEPAFRSRSAFAYFGLAPIPLAMQLGYLLEDLADVAVYQRHHEHRDWKWRSDHAPIEVRVRRDHDVFATDVDGDAVIRISTWHPIDAAATRAVLPQGALVEIDIDVAAPGPDAVSRPEDVRALAESFQLELDAISDKMRSATVHVFAAVPVGVALEMGRRVSPTKHRPVQTYQYFARESPSHRAAFVLQHARAAAPRSISAADVESAVHERAIWNGELRALAARASSREGAPWTSLLDAADGRWRALPTLESVAHVLTQVVDDAVDEFEYREAQGWALSAPLLVAMRKHLGDDERIRLAARLFFLHEALHHEWHKLVPGVSDGVGRLPRVLEELDYQADVWALLHELAVGGKDVVERARQMVDLVLATLWAFNDGEGPLNEIPVRRMHRYLIWYWQAVRLERARTSADVIGFLTRKPTVEIGGLRPHVVGSRVLYRLDESHGDLELGVLEDDRIARRPDGQAYRVKAIVEAFRNRDGSAIKNALRPLFQELQPRTHVVSGREGT